jgi:2'-5' RNA ligase
VIRLFVALEIPASVRAALLALAGGVPGARWQTDAQMHLTLRFIGDVDENVAEAVDDSLSVIAARAFSLELAGTGEFGGKIPRALWAGVRANDALAHLQKKVDVAVQRVGLPPDARKFSPHVTLARLRGAPREKMMAFLAHNSLFAGAPFSVERFVLFSSELSHQGSIYRAERFYPLQSGG